jgi:hypothetical protein
MVVVYVTRKTITSITEQGLYYRDNDGVEHFIDFEICLRNRIAYKLEHNLVKPEKREEFRRESRCIGERRTHNEYPCIDFYTDPITRLVFIYSNILFRIFDRREYHERFIRFAYRDLIDAGYNSAEVG